MTEKLTRTGELIPSALYANIEDVKTRSQIRVGELVQVAAINNGIGNLIPESVQEDDICSCIAGVVLDRLNRFDQHTATTVLKSAKRLARQVLSDDKEERNLVIDELNEHISAVCNPSSEFPELPQAN